jgi:DNA-binding GntR family transcriptional regulator
MTAVTAVRTEPEARTLAERAYQQLVVMITRLRLAPGQIVNERQLMAELGIGRTPIREALYRLVSEGLVIHHHNRGMFIADINATTVKHIYEFRSLIEMETARLAASRARPSDIAELMAVASRMKSAAAAADVDRYMELDRTFYAVLARASENEFLRDVIPRLFNHHLRIWFYIASRSGGWDAIMRAHVEMVEEVAAGVAGHEPERAAAALGKYISERYRDAMAVM